MTVTALRQTSPDRITLVLDETEELKTTLGVVTEHRLYKGAELDDKEAGLLRRDSARALARERAITLTSRRMYSRKELRDKLIAKGEDADVADYCVDWLAERGIIDDALYAAAIVRHYSSKSMGAARIRVELKRRGIDRELWDEALETLPDTSSALDRYIRFRLPDPYDLTAMRRLNETLYRRGYAWEDIRAAMSRYLKEYEENR